MTAEPSPPAAESAPASLEEIAARALLRPSSQQAVEFRGRWYGWGDLRAAADRVATLLDAAGAAPRAPVAFVSRNRPSAVGALMGLMRAGRHIRMVHPFQSPPSLVRELDRIDPAAVLIMAEDDSAEMRALLRARGLAALLLDVLDVDVLPGCERCSATPALRAGPPEIHILTSGTTGPPKPFPVSYALIAKHMVGSNLFAPDGLGAEEKPPIFTYFPLGNISGLLTAPFLFNGERVVLADRFTVADWRDYVRRYRPAMLGVPPAGVQMLLDAEVPQEELASVRWLNTGAAPLDPAVHRAFEARYGVPILLSYGATEFAGAAAMMTPALHAEWGERKFGSVGRPLPGVAIRVVEPEGGGVLPPGAEGLLEVQVERLGPDWIRTSDLGLVDEDGFVFLRGRADGAIMRGGFKILPETVERALLLHEAVAAAGVVGIADRRLGEAPAAVIELRPGAAPPDVAELERRLREHLLATHIPVAWRFVDELPKNASFKVDRGALRALFEGPPSDQETS